MRVSTAEPCCRFSQRCSPICAHSGLDREALSDRLQLELALLPSSSGTESAMSPQPAKAAAVFGAIKTERMATTNSPSPLALIQPMGPAYQPRSGPRCH